MKRNVDKLFVIIIALLCLLMYFIPTGFPDPYDDYERVKAKVLTADNSALYQRGVVQTGVQRVELEVMDGAYRGQQLTVSNNLMGKLEMDKVFQAGDVGLLVVKGDGQQIQVANLIDHYRMDAQLILFGLFAALLFAFAGWTGVKAVLSFVFTIMALWKVLWPAFLLGWDPVITSMLAVCLIAGCVVFLVAGVNKTALAAFSGTILGALTSCILAIVFGKMFKIHGAVVPYAETLLHLGFPNINITKIFIAGIFLASSGAMMDVAVDIAVAVKELVMRDPTIGRKQAIHSGFEVGRAVVGAMTTTLLLAYTGAYTALMMVFIAQGTPIINVLNLTYISAEIMHTLIGSIGVVLVAPFTAIMSGYLLAAKQN